MREQIDPNGAETRFVGVSVPIPFWKRLREEATRDDTTLSGLLKSALINHLERDRRKVPASE